MKHGDVVLEGADAEEQTDVRSARRDGKRQQENETKRNAAQRDCPPNTQASSRISDTWRSEATFVTRQEGVVLPPRERGGGLTTTSS